MALNDYHIWQLPELSAKNPNESIEFETLRNNLGNGYQSIALYGSSTGLRKWKLRLSTLAALSVLPNTVTDISGAAVSREQYVWDLYCETMVTGEPFAYRSPRNGQYYLVRFVNQTLDYQKMLVALYSTGIELEQVRLDGETVFDVSQAANIYGSYVDGNFNAFGWQEQSLPDSVKTLIKTGNVAATGTQNGLTTVQFNVGATNDGFIAMTNDPVIYEAFIVMKMREATFSNFAGILTADTGTAALLGDSGTTKFFDLGFADSYYDYRLNTVEYAANNQQAPMNAFGVVHLRFSTGIGLTNLQIGRDRVDATRYAEVDIGEIILCDGLLSRVVRREIDENLAVKWGI